MRAASLEQLERQRALASRLAELRRERQNRVTDMAVASKERGCMAMADDMRFTDAELATSQSMFDSVEFRLFCPRGGAEASRAPAIPSDDERWAILQQPYHYKPEWLSERPWWLEPLARARDASRGVVVCFCPVESGRRFLFKLGILIPVKTSFLELEKLPPFELPPMDFASMLYATPNWHKWNFENPNVVDMRTPPFVISVQFRGQLLLSGAAEFVIGGDGGGVVGRCLANVWLGDRRLLGHDIAEFGG